MAMLAALDLVTFDDCEAEDLKCRDDESERLKQRGNVAYKKRDFCEAVNCYFKALKANPKNVSAMSNLAAVCLEEKRFVESIRICKRILRMTSNSNEVFKAKLEARIQKAREEASKFNASPYVIGSLPDKGKGLIAVKIFETGELIVSEKPLLVVDKRQNDLNTKFSRLSADSKRRVLELSGGPDVASIFEANASHLDDYRSGLFAVMSRINHSCVPNTNFVWRSDLNEQQVIAIRKIESGEEITDSYFPDDALWTFEERRSRLEATHAFKCQCLEMCGKSRDAISADDLRIGVLRDLRDQSRSSLLACERLVAALAQTPRVVQANFSLLALEALFIDYVGAKKDTEAFRVAQNLAAEYESCVGVEFETSRRWRSLVNHYFGLVRERGKFLSELSRPFSQI